MSGLLHSMNCRLESLCKRNHIFSKGEQRELKKFASAACSDPFLGETRTPVFEYQILYESGKWIVTRQFSKEEERAFFDSKANLINFKFENEVPSEKAVQTLYLNFGLPEFVYRFEGNRCQDVKTFSKTEVTLLNHEVRAVSVTFLGRRFAHTKRLFDFPFTNAEEIEFVYEFEFDKMLRSLGSDKLKRISFKSR